MRKLWKVKPQDVSLVCTKPTFLNRNARTLELAITQQRLIKAHQFNMKNTQSLPTLSSATQSSTNYCMYYIQDGETGRNQSAALKSCCSPKTVYSESQNALWCEITDRFFQGLPHPGVNDSEASGWVQGNFTHCQIDQGVEIGANYCHLPRYNPSLRSAASMQGQSQLVLLCLVMWLWLFSR